jgi:Co/Zn/Cd efflux system component
MLTGAVIGLAINNLGFALFGEERIKKRELLFDSCVMTIIGAIIGTIAYS